MFSTNKGFDRDKDKYKMRKEKETHILPPRLKG